MSAEATHAQPKQAPQLAYEAYCEILEGYADPSGPWEELTPIYRQAWIAAAEAVRESERSER